MTCRFFDPQRGTRVASAPGKDQRYEVWCRDECGNAMQVGWSTNADGGSLTQMVNLHPGWHSPWTVDLRAPLSQEEDLGDVSDHLLERMD